MKQTKLYKLNDSVSVECIRGDISDQPDMDVVVNAANALLLPGGGVAGAIHRKAGPGLVEECDALAPIKPGQAVITKAHALPNKYVIHCLGPVYGIDSNEEKLLASCYRSALNLAESHVLNSIAFPSISTGIFGYPLREAARVSLQTIRNFSGYNNLKHIRMVLWGDEDFNIYKQAIAEIFA